MDYQLLQALHGDAGPQALIPQYINAGLGSLHQVKLRPSSVNQRRRSNIAVLSLAGTITQRSTVLSRIFGGTSTEEFRQALHAALVDRSVNHVVIDIDSPGGSVYGVDELAAEIYEARATKKVHAIANSLMASAAYWIGSSANDVSCTPSGEVGSIGVYGMHTDYSKFDAEAGIKTTLISAGRYKTEGNEFAPLSTDARSAMQRRVDSYYSMMVKAIARNRGISQTAVRDRFGEGRVLGARDALAVEMIDRIESLDEMLGRLAR